MTDLSKAEQKLVEQLGDFVKLFVHKGEDGDDPPEEWAWTIRGSFPTGVMLWIRSHTDALILAAYEACAKHFPFKWSEGCSCGFKWRSPFVPVVEMWQAHIRSLASEAAREELAAMKEQFFPQGFPLSWLEAVRRMERQHDADLREVAEMAIAAYKEALADGCNFPNGEKILREFREQKAEVK